MERIKLVLLRFLLLLSVVGYAQFSVKTELKYLQIINIQDNENLIKDNLLNAELLVDSIILSSQKSIDKGNFLVELSKSYYLVGKYDLSLFSLLQQRCLFPDKNIQKQSQNLFLEASYSNNLTDSLAHSIYNNTSFEKVSKNVQERFHLLLKMAMLINTKKLSNYIYKTGLVYRSLEHHIPSWYQHWEYLTIVKLKPRHIKKALKDVNNGDAPIYSQLTDKKLKYKIYRKSIKHYRKHKSYRIATDLLTEYKTYKLGAILRVDATFRTVYLKIVQIRLFK